MSKQKKLKVTINAKGNEISVVSNGDENDFISITDIAKYKSEDPTATIQNWMRNKDTIEFLGLYTWRCCNEDTRAAKRCDTKCCKGYEFACTGSAADFHV